MGKVNSICVLGGGHGAHGMAADMALQGFKVRFCEAPEFEADVQKVLETKQIRLSGIREGVAELEMATTDYSRAIPGADIVFVVIPAFAHQRVFDRAAPYFEPGQIVVFPPGNFSSLAAHQTLKGMGKEKDVIVAEAATLPYGVRMVEPAHTKIMVDAINNPVAAMPGNRTGEILESIKECYPAFLDGGNVLRVGIDNPNPSAHPVATMLNTGRIEFADQFYLYREAFTPSVHRVVGVVDSERQSVLRRMGMTGLLPEDIAVEGDEALVGIYYYFGEHALDAGRQMIGPLHLQDRYVTEDIPFGHKPVVLLGKAIGVPTPVSEAMVTLASTINAADYMNEGYSLEDLGLAGKTAEEIAAFVETGEG